MKNFFLLTFILCLLMVFAHPCTADEFEFSMLEKRFENFIRCELTRTDATNHFKGRPFKITMVDLFDIQSESDLKIVTGAVQCFVEKAYQTLFIAVAVKSIMEKEQILYYTIRKNDFSILATELIQFPYKERCKWSEYWVDTD